MMWNNEDIPLRSLTADEAIKWTLGTTNQQSGHSIEAQLSEISGLSTLSTLSTTKTNDYEEFDKRLLYKKVGRYRDSEHLEEDLRAYPRLVPCPMNDYHWEDKENCSEKCPVVPLDCVYFSIAPYNQRLQW